MKLKGKIIKISLVLFVLGGIAVASILWQSKSPDGKGLSDLGILLTKPVFAQETGVNFLEQEAGISAWMNAGKSIDLTKAKAVFKTIEKNTNDYINGSIALSGYPETEDVHAFVHKDGWIVSYYMKNNPAAKIMDWNNYKIDNKIKGTKLENGIFAVCTAVSIAAKDIKYYDFRNPDANKIMIIIAQSKNFRIRLPIEHVFYERSYSFFADSGWGTIVLKIDAKDIINIYVPSYYSYSSLSSDQLSPDVFHTVSSQNGYVAIALIQNFITVTSFSLAG